MSILYILAAVLMLGVIIFLHELGHFVAGRAMGIGVNEFAVGMGPKVFGWEKNGTKYSLRCIPLGGYCAFVGEDDGNDAQNAMNAQPAWKRIVTVFAGPFMNFLVAFVIAVVLIATHSIPNIYETTSVPVITGVIENMPAEAAGVQKNDIIIAVNGEQVSYDDSGVALVKSKLSADESIVLTVKRGEEGETVDITLTPEYDAESGKLLLGVYFPTIYASYDCGFFGAIPEALKFMGRTVVETVNMLGSLLGKLFTGGKVESGSVSGVVGIVSQVSEGMSDGFSSGIGDGLFVIAYYIMAISLSLGIMNLLPFPALDGGRLVLLVIEAITGKHLKREAEGIINLIGFAVLIILMIVVTFSDVKSLIK